jgi:hypothetical protein
MEDHIPPATRARHKNRKPKTETEKTETSQTKVFFGYHSSKTKVNFGFWFFVWFKPNFN